MHHRLRIILLSLATLAVAGFLVAILTGWQFSLVPQIVQGRTKPTVKVGLIHSQSGPLGSIEKSLIDAELMAIDEINASGGVDGHQIEATLPDPRSDAATYASTARRLIQEEKVVVLFGGFTSECRKAMLEVVEQEKSLLFFPGNFEGIENSHRLVYAGGSSNQSVLPAVRWTFDNLKARRYFVIGAEEVWSRTASEIAKDGVKAAGGEIVGERYLPLNDTDVDGLVEAIAKAHPDVVLNFLYGQINGNLFSAMRRMKFTPETLPVVSFGFGEDDLRKISPSNLNGHFAGWNYFQSVPRKENHDFVKRFKQKFSDDRVISDPMMAAYNAVKIWAQTVNEVRSLELQPVIAGLDRQSLASPEGIVTVDPESRAFWRPFHIGRCRSDGQFDILYSIDRPIRPLTYVSTRRIQEWDRFLADLHRTWGDHWSSLGGANAKSGD